MQISSLGGTRRFVRTLEQAVARASKVETEAAIGVLLEMERGKSLTSGRLDLLLGVGDVGLLIAVVLE